MVMFIIDRGSGSDFPPAECLTGCNSGLFKASDIISRTVKQIGNTNWWCNVSSFRVACCSTRAKKTRLMAQRTFMRWIKGLIPTVIILLGALLLGCICYISIWGVPSFVVQRVEKALLEKGDRKSVV